MSSYDDFIDDAHNFGSGDPGDEIEISLSSDYFTTDFIISPHQAWVLFNALADDARDTHSK